MRSWAHTYLVGALSGTVLIVAAVVAFIPLVSLQALRDWPISGLGFGTGGGTSRVGEAHALTTESTHAGRGVGSIPNGGPSASSGGAVQTADDSGRGSHANGAGGVEADSPGSIPPPSEEAAQVPNSHSPVAAVPAPSPAPVPSSPSGGSAGTHKGSGSANADGQGAPGDENDDGTEPASVMPAAKGPAHHPASTAGAASPAPAAGSTDTQGAQGSPAAGEEGDQGNQGNQGDQG